MVTMWVCTRHTRMRWFKSPWTPPCPAHQIYSREQTGPKPRSLKARRDGPTCIRLSHLPSSINAPPSSSSCFLSHTHSSDVTSEFLIHSFISPVFFISSSSSLYVLFWCKQKKRPPSKSCFWPKSKWSQETKSVTRGEESRPEEKKRADKQEGKLLSLM